MIRFRSGARSYPARSAALLARSSVRKELRSQKNRADFIARLRWDRLGLLSSSVCEQRQRLLLFDRAIVEVEDRSVDVNTELVKVITKLLEVTLPVSTRENSAALGRRAAAEAEKCDKAQEREELPHFHPPDWRFLPATCFNPAGRAVRRPPAVPIVILLFERSRTRIPMS